MTVASLILSVVALIVALFAAATVLHTDLLIQKTMERLAALEKDLGR